MTRFAFNPRYTIVAFPYFCLLVGVALTFLVQKNRWAGILALSAVLGVSTASLANLFFNPYYAKEDVRSAVALWRTLSSNEPLLVCSPAGGAKDVVRRYLDAQEEKRMFPVGSRDLIKNTATILATNRTNSAYIIFIRDWRTAREKAIRSAFTVENGRSFPSVRVIRILRQ
jgi:hypothetical protein